MLSFNIFIRVSVHLRHFSKKKKRILICHYSCQEFRNVSCFANILFGTDICRNICFDILKKRKRRRCISRRKRAKKTCRIAESEETKDCSYYKGVSGPTETVPSFFSPPPSLGTDGETRTHSDRRLCRIRF